MCIFSTEVNKLKIRFLYSKKNLIFLHQTYYITKTQWSVNQTITNSLFYMALSNV